MWFGREQSCSRFCPDSPLRRAFPSHHQYSNDNGVSTDTSISDKTPCRRRGSQRSHSSQSGSDSDGTRSSGGRRKKKDGFSSKIQIPEFGGKKGHTHDVAGAFRQWARCITYYRDYYEDSYLMPLVVSSLMGDTSDILDWILSLNPGNTQDLTTLLQMLRVPHLPGAEEYYRESSPEASGGRHRLFNKGRHLCEQLG